MKELKTGVALFIGILFVTSIAAAANRNWEQGKLLDTDQQKVHAGSTTTYNTTGDANSRNGNSRNTIATTSDDTDTYEVYTIQGPEKTYVAHEKLMFPWSKPANVTVGGSVKYAIEGRKLYIFDEDHKEHKASIVKTSLNRAE